MAQVKLRVLRDYRAWDWAYNAGEEIEAPESMADWLMRDAPGAFEKVLPPQPEAGEEKGIDIPEVDKMVKRAPRKK